MAVSGGLWCLLVVMEMVSGGVWYQCCLMVIVSSVGDCEC